MYIIITILFIIVTILSVIVFKLKGFLSLVITVPLIIMYVKSNNIINILKAALHIINITIRNNVENDKKNINSKNNLINFPVLL